MFKIDSNPTEFFADIDNEGIAIVLEHDLCMFGSL
jgi:hypothetical protein